MDSGNLVRDGLELLIVVAIGGTLVSAVKKLRRGEIEVVRCSACERPTSRGYARCKHCGVPQPR